METALNIKPPLNRDPTAEKDSTDTAAAAAEEEAVEKRRSKGVVHMQVLSSAELARRVGVM